jgi:hypothetical protein
MGLNSIFTPRRKASSCILETVAEDRKRHSYSVTCSSQLSCAFYAEECTTVCEVKCTTPVCAANPSAECKRQTCETCDHAFISQARQVECTTSELDVVVISTERLMSESSANTTVQHRGTRAAPRGKKEHNNSKYPGFCEEPVLINADKQIFTVHCVSPSVSLLPGHVRTPVNHCC